MTRERIFANARFAGEVLRYHTWPVHRRQSVGEHIWQQMRIWYQIWGPMPPEISTYILWSDAGELVLGDLPFPVKLRNPTLKDIADRIENDAVMAMRGELPLLPDLDKIRVKMCDLLEMWEFGLCELNMGNQFAQPIVDDILIAVDDLRGKLPVDDIRIGNYIRTTLNRLE